MSFERFVREVAAAHGVAVGVVRCDPRLGCHARSSLRNGGTLTYGSDVMAGGDECARWTAAHEVAHLALGHGALAAESGFRRAACGALWAV